MKVAMGCRFYLLQQQEVGWGGSGDVPVAERPRGVYIGTCDETQFDVGGSAAGLNHGYFDVERTLVPHRRWPRNKINSNDSSGGRAHLEITDHPDVHSR